MISSSLSTANSSPLISRSVTPMPNLLYTTVSPTFTDTHLSPMETTEPVPGPRRERERRALREQQHSATQRDGSLPAATGGCTHAAAATLGECWQQRT